MIRKPSISKILRQTSFDDVFESMTYVKDKSIQARRTTLNLFNSLQNIIPTDSEYHLHLVDRWEGCLSRIDLNCTIRDKNDEIKYIIEDFQNLEEIMGMEVWIDNDVEINNAEIIAGLCWELKYLINPNIKFGLYRGEEIEVQALTDYQRYV